MSQATHSPTGIAGDSHDAGTIARDGDTTARRALASDTETRPEVLYYLAEDPDAEVRRCIADNAKTPRQAHLLLALDDSEEVRCVLAGKIGRLFPDTSVTERDVMRQAVLDTTEVLAADQTKRVRELVSDAIKGLPNVPPHLVRQLATDPYLTVCGPVLEYSPVLTEEDLLEIIESSPVQGALGAISRRASVGETVSHAIAESNDVDAISDLLANPSAQIREETLDSLIEGAPSVPVWHGPLVNRPTLHLNAAQRIAGFVAYTMLDTLRRRTDLEKNVVDAIESVVTERLNGHTEPKSQDIEDEMGRATDALQARVLKLMAEGRLTEKFLHDAAVAGDREMVAAGLAACSGLSRDAVKNVFEMRASKGIVALCWKSGMSMELAYTLQITLGSIAPSAVLTSNDDSSYPLSDKELTWQIEFFGT